MGDLSCVSDRWFYMKTVLGPLLLTTGEMSYVFVTQFIIHAMMSIAFYMTVLQYLWLEVPSITFLEQMQVINASCKMQ